MNMDMKNKKSTWVIAAVLIVGLVLGIAILRMDRAQPAGEGHDHAEAAHGKDDHDLDHMGGKGHDEAGNASTAPAKDRMAASCSPRAALAWN